jgi:hypothetical protein
VIREENKLILISAAPTVGHRQHLERFVGNVTADADATSRAVFIFTNPGRERGKALLQESQLICLKPGARFHTCHCTARRSMEVLKSAMGTFEWISFHRRRLDFKRKGIRAAQKTARHGCAG